MNSFLTSSFISLFGSKIVRAAIAYIVAFAAAHHVALDTNSLFTFVGTALAGIGIIVWSMIAKAQPDDGTREKLGDFAHACASMIVPGIMGILRAKGISITGSENLEELGLIGLNVLSSALNKPDAKKPPVNAGAVKAMIALMVCASLLACTQHPIAYKRADGTEVVSLGGSLMTKAASETATATTASGTVLSYTIEAKDETIVPSTYLRTGAQKSISGSLFNKGSGLINATR